MVKLLALDPAESTGYAVLEVDTSKKTATICEYGFLDVDKKSEYVGDWCIDLMTKVEALIKKYSISDVCVEDYFFSGRFARGANVNPSFRAAIYIKCRELNIDYSVLNISLWKTYVAGRSTPTKEQKLKWGKEAAKKLMIQQALWERFGFRFPNHSISNTTGKPIVFRYDVVDAVGQGMFHCFAKYSIANFACTVPVPPDFAFKKASKKSFTY